MGAEAFTILAILEATDRMSRVIEKVDGSLNGLASTAARAAEATTVAGQQIDASLLETASGTDAVKLADARLSAAQTKAATTADAQANAERRLLEAQSQLAGADEGDVVAKSRLIAASESLTEAQKQNAIAVKEATDATAHQADVNRASYLSTTEGANAAAAATARQRELAAAQSRSAAGAELMKKSMMFGALGIAAVGVISVKTAGDFESMTQHLVTDAGESQKNIGMIRAGMLQLSVDTGTTTSQMSAGMYHVESAGFHGAEALKVMQVAAEGAKVGGADLDTVAKALTGTMNAYGMSGSQATSMMNQLITTVGQGDMKMQDLASSLGAVAPLAAAAKIKFSEVGAALATMTAQNMTASQASQDLANTIRGLMNPLKPARDEMAALGLQSNEVTKELGSKGLVATLKTLTDALAAHTKGGEIFTATLKNSQVAAQNASIALKALDPSIQGAAAAWQKGTLSTSDFNKQLKLLPPTQANLGHQFEAMAKKAGSFNDLLKSGSPSAQSFTAALSKLMGGSTGLNTALMITGGRMDTFKGSAAKIAEAATKGGAHVEDWDKIQGTFNQKMERAKAAMEATGITIGSALLPAVSKLVGIIMSIIGPMVSWIAQHQKLVGLLLAVIGPMIAVVGVIKMISIVTKLWAAAQLLLNTAVEDNPIGLIITLIAGLVIGLIYAYNHFKTFHDIVNTVFNAVKTVVMIVVHALVAAFNWVVAAAISMWHGLVGAWNAVVGAAKSVWGFLVGVWNGIYDTTMTVWNAISGFFMKWWPLLLAVFLPPIAALLALWNHFHDQITSTVMTVWNGIKSFLNGSWNMIKSVASTLWNSIKTAIINPVLALWALMQPVIHAIESFLSGVWHGILSIVTTLWNSIKTAIINPIISAWNQIVSIGGKIASAISTVFHGALNAVSNVGSWFLNLGDSIIMGVINGIENAAGSLFNAMVGVAKGALNAAKHFLGVGSPSKEFANQVGKWIPHGIAQGVNDHADVAQNSVKKLASSLIVAAHGSVSGNIGIGVGGSSLSPTNGGVGGGGVVIHMDMRGTTLMTDRDMDVFVQKVGKAIATKILPQGGVRIRM